MPASVTLPPALPGEWHEVQSRAGRLGYYVAGTGLPLLLVHSVNAAASAYEVRPVFERMLDRRRVFALDLPGFGTSDRSARRYDVRLFVDALLDMLEVIALVTGHAPVDALALSLGAEFLSRAVTEQPHRFRSVALVTPTGFGRRASAKGEAGATREIPGLHRLLTVPLWEQGLYDLLVSRRSIRYFLRRTWGSSDIDEGLAEYDYVSAHQPGARHAPYAFVSGRLFSKDITTVYERLMLPVWMPCGTRGDFGDFSRADRVRSRANWRIDAFDTGAFPHFERADAFVDRYTHFLNE